MPDALLRTAVDVPSYYRKPSENNSNSVTVRSNEYSGYLSMFLRFA